MATKKAGRRGRPPLPKEQLRDEIVPVRLTLAERRKLEKVSARSGQNLSEWIRQALTRSANQ